MPRRCVALLRAINVGGRTVRKERLRDVFTDLGFANVSTFIASGNVLFDAPRGSTASLEKRIEQQLAASLGFDVDTFIRTADEMHAAAEHEPFPDAEVNGTLYIGFLKTPPSPDSVSAVMALDSPHDRFAIHGTELYWLPEKGLSDSRITGARLEKLLAGPATLRNRNTVKKVAALLH